MNITQGLRRALQVNPDGAALICKDRTKDWRTVGNRVSRLAAMLRQLGVGPGARIAALMLNSDRYFELYLAASWAGGVIVPLNTRWSVTELRDALLDCEAALLVVDDCCLPSGTELSAELPEVQLIYAGDAKAPAAMTDYETLIASGEPCDDAMRGGDDLAAIFYTGGTTGRSKGVMLSHRNLAANAFNVLAEGMYGEDAVYLHVAPMFHVADAAAICALTASSGTSVFIEAFSADAVCEAIAVHRVNEVMLVPTMIQMMIDDPAIERHDLGSLRKILYGSSPISPALLDRAIERLPDIQFMSGYGMTELSPLATFLGHRDHVGEGRAKGRYRSVGRATYGCELKVVLPDGREAPHRAVGEIIARGDNVMQGYWRLPKETSEAIRDGWMHTGDGGWMDEDGYVYLADRIKDMIISGGENVYSLEVENVASQYPGVLECSVIGIPDERWGEAVHLILVPKPGAEVDANGIIAFCRSRIAGYKCPRSVEIRTERLPLSAAGKILKRELRAPYWSDSQAH